VPRAAPVIKYVVSAMIVVLLDLSFQVEFL